MSEIIVKAPKAGTELKADISEKLFDTIEEYIEEYGEEKVKNLIDRMVTTDLRNGIRAKLEAGASEEDFDPSTILDWVAEWSPGTRKAAKSAEEKAMDLFESLSPEEKLAALQKMQEKVKAEG